MTIDHTLTLDYQLQPGWLSPFIEGLQKGIAVARCCNACSKTTFPPIRTCECNHVEGEWITLSGTADIVHRCDGSEGSFALVRFQGADTHTVVRLADMVESSQVGYLQASQSNSPALVITPGQEKRGG